MHFVYTAMNSSGKEETGLLSAANTSFAEMELKKQDLFPTSIGSVELNFEQKEGYVFKDPLSCKLECDEVKFSGLLNIRANDSGIYEIVFIDEGNGVEKILSIDAVNVELAMGFVKTTLVIMGTEEKLAQSSREEVLQAFNTVDKELQTFFYDAMVSDYERWGDFLKAEFEQSFKNAVNSGEFEEFGFDDFELVCEKVPDFWKRVYKCIQETIRNDDPKAQVFCLELLDFLTPEAHFPDIIKEIEPLCDSPVRKLRCKARKVFNNYIEDPTQYKNVSLTDKIFNFFSVFFRGANFWDPKNF